MMNMKKRKIIIGSIIFLLFLTLVGIILYQKDSFRFKISYEYINYMEYNNGKKIKVSIPWHNPIQYVSERELIDFLKEGTGILYFGYNTCPWCRNAIPVLIEASQSQGIDKIYYADIHHLNLSSIREELYQIIDSYLEEEEGKKVLAVPDVYFVKNGQIVGEHRGTVDSYHNPYSPMNQDERKELLQIYKRYIKEIVYE